MISFSVSLSLSPSPPPPLSLSRVRAFCLSASRAQCMVITGYDFSLWQRRSPLSRGKSERNLVFAVSRPRKHTVKNAADQFSFSLTQTRARARTHTHTGRAREASRSLYCGEEGLACSTTACVSTFLWAESGRATASLSRPSEPRGWYRTQWYTVVPYTVDVLTLRNPPLPGVDDTACTIALFD